MTDNTQTELHSNAVEVEAVTVTELSAFAQNEYYVKKWAGINDKKLFCGFNWSAACLGSTWLFCRKFYTLGALMFLLMRLVQYASTIFAPAQSTYLILSVFIICRVTLGSLANYLYYRVAKVKIEKIDAANLPNDVHFQAIKNAGGMSLVGFFVALALSWFSRQL